MNPSTHHDGTAAGLICAVDARAPQNDAPGREIGPRDDLHQLRQFDRRIVDHRDTRIDDFRQVVRRNVGRHADGDAARTVDQQVREAGGQHLGFAARSVVGILEIDGLLVDVLQKLVRHLGQARFGVTHGGWRIAVDRAEIALPVDERHAHRPVLRHADQRIIDRGIAVRVVFTHHVGDGARGFHIFAVPMITALVRSVENAPMNGFEAIANIRQRPADDDAHRVIEIGALHLLDNGDWLDAFRQILRAARRGLVSQCKSRSCLGITGSLYRITG